MGEKSATFTTNIQYGASSLPQMEKLRGAANYETWAMDMEMYLIHEDMWDFVSEPLPESASGTEKKLAQKAKAKIYMLLESGPKVEVTGKKTAYDMWIHLKATYENKNVNRRIALIDQLFDVKLANFSDMEEYVQKFTKINTKLKSMGKQIDDELLAVLMLRGLTEDYRPFRMAVEKTATDKLKMETVKQMLLQEGYRMSTDTKTSSVETATTSNDAGEGDGGGENRLLNGEVQEQAASQDTKMGEDKSRSEATFRYTVHNVSKLKETELSPPCIIRNLPWRIRVMPRGSTTSAPDHQQGLGFFLHCDGDSDLNSWSCFALADLRIVSQKEGVESFTRNIKHLFYSKEYDWGYRNFIPMNKVLDPEKGFVKDDSIILEVHVTVDDSVSELA